MLIIENFKNEIRQAAKSIHDIVSEYEEILDKYSKSYPETNWEDIFNTMIIQEPLAPFHGPAPSDDSPMRDMEPPWWMQVRILPRPLINY